ncbi:MAG TPA: IPT/TIG domain-containing protein [Caulobacteraceae bacterium]
MRRPLFAGLAAFGLVLGLAALAPTRALAGPVCNIHFTVAENSGDTTYIFNATDLANCDPAFGGLDPLVQTPALGGLYTPSAGGTYTTQSTANDDRIDYTPRSGFHGTETFQICGEAGTTSCGTVTVTVNPATVVVSPASLPSGTSGSPYSTSVSASGGKAPYTYTVFIGALPPGLLLAPSTGAIGGTPTTPGNYSFGIQAADSSTGATGAPSPVLSYGAFAISIAAPPTVTSVSPNSGAGGASVTITGSGFTGATAVKFGATPATSFTVFSDSQISAIAPPGTGSVDVTVTSTGTSATSPADQFTYFTTPTITSVSPNFGSTAGGTSVTITGTGFTGATSVSFGSTQTATSFTVNSSTSITATAPTGSFPGAVDIRVSTPAGISSIGGADQFTYVAPPVVGGLTPFNGAAAGGTAVTIGGSGFTGATAVTFGGIPAANFTVQSSTAIVAISPPGTALAMVAVQVTTPIGTSQSNPGAQFTYLPPPAVTSVSPSSGASNGGATVTITGNGFTGATAVAFGASPATSFTVNSDSSITAVAPAGAGTVDVTVTAVGTSATGAADKFTYLTTPTVQTVAPNSGPASGGTIVTISGSGFANATAVKFGAAAASSFRINDDTSISAIAPAGAAGTVDITITNAAGTSATAAADQFTYIAAPSVTSLSNTSGPTGGGTVVTISGTGFSGATAVHFGALAGLNVTVNSATSITATAPAESAGVVDVTVTGPGGTSATGAGDQFTFIPPPTVTGVNPTTGSMAGGTVITITGTSFVNVLNVQVGGVSATGITVNSPTSVTATTPLRRGSPGAVDVVVITSNGPSRANSADEFTYVNLAATTTSVASNHNPSSSGTAVTFTATVSGPGSPSGTVQFSDANGTFSAGVALSSGHAAYTTSAIAVTSGDLVTASYSGDSGNAASTGTVNQTVLALPPTVTSVSPGVGPTTGGTTVTITGTSFTGATAVKFGATAATSFTVNSDTSITATSPAGLNLVDVTVTTASGTSATSAADHFAFEPVATVTSISPASGPVGGVVTLNGSFADVAGVLFGTTPAQFIAGSATQVTVTAPPGTGTVDITVVELGGTSAKSTADQFTYTFIPSIRQVEPNSGPAAGGTVVLIDATNLAAVTGVTFGSTAASFSYDSINGFFSVTAPAGSGTVDIRLTSADGTSPVVAADQFTYLPAPTVTSVSPAAGPTSGGTTVTISGSGFTGATAVRFGATPATSFTVNSASSITATAPAGSGTVDVTITTSGGTSAAGPADGFTYAPVPTVTGLSTTLGASSGGTTVTISGSGFTGATAVSFGGTPATSYTVNSASSITATSPAGTGSVDVTVTTPGGTSATSGGDQFTYVAAPTVTSINPTSGPTTGGTSVTLSGANFAGATAVTFGGVAAASFTVNSATAITAVAPAGVGAVDLRVTTVGGTSATSGADQFTYVPAPSVSSVSPSSGPATGGTSVTITGANLTGATVVRFGATTATSFTVNSASQITATSPAASAGTVDVTVTTVGGASTTGSGDHFTYTAVTLSPNSLTSPTVGVAYTTPLSASGGVSGYTFTSTPLPAGLTLASNGTLSGTPTAGGTFNFTVTATDSVGATGAQAYALTINPATITVSPTSLAAMTQGVATSQSISATGGTTTYAFTVTGGPLPAGLTLATNGALTGAPSGSGPYSFTVTATDSSTGAGPYTGTRLYSGTIAPGIPVTAGKSVNTAYDTAVAIDLTSSITVATPSSVTVASAPSHGSTSVSGLVVTYTPATGFAGTDTFAYTATGPGGTSTPSTVTITVGAPTVSLAPTSLPSPSVGVAYSQTITGVGGLAPFKAFTVSLGGLPPGLSLNNTTGVVSGTPTAAGGFSFTVQATDSSTGAGPFTAIQAYSVTVAAPAITFSSTTLPGATVENAYNQSVSASGGTAPFTYSATGLPAGLTLNSSTGAISGTPTAGGTFNVTIKATDSSTGTGAPFSASQAYSLVVAAPAITLTPTSLTAMTQEIATSQQLSASGGVAPYTFAVNGTLPAGLALSSSGLLAGTPTGAGAYSFSVVATDSATGSGPFKGTQLYSGTIGAGVPVAAAKSVTVAYDTATPIDLTSSISGAAATTVTVKSNPQHGAVSVSGLVVTYTPTTGYAGPDSFSYFATGPGGSSTTAAVSITVSTPTLTITPTTLANATDGAAYNQALTGNGGQAPYTFTLSAGSLPAGVTLSATGVISGTPTAAGDFNITVKAVDSSTGAGAPFSTTQAYTLHVQAPVLKLTPTSLPDGVFGGAYHQSVNASGGTAPYVYSLAGGALPAGLTLGSDGVVAGTPTTSGAFTFNVKAVDSSTGTGAPFSITQSVSLKIDAPTISITPTTLPNATDGVAYKQALSAAGGVGPYVFTVSQGKLPAGLSLSSAGVLSGTPTVFGGAGFTVTATDSAAAPGPYSGAVVYVLQINLPPAPTAAPKSVTLPVGGAPIAIDLSGSITGVATSVSVIAAPSHGSTQVSGETVTYAPAAGYFGADSFTYEAVGPGGNSAPATVSLTIPAPAPVTTADTATTPANQPVTIAVTANDSGPINSIAIAAKPAHGTATITNLSVVYTPAANYFGPDSFTYTATGPGGTSAATAVQITVTPLAVPTAAALTGVVVSGRSVTLDPTVGATGGPFTATAIATAPAAGQGTATISGTSIVYTAPDKFSGQVTFTYTLANPFGVSPPATAMITVNPAPAPAVANVNRTIDASQQTSVNLTDGATGGPFIAAMIVGQSPQNGGTAKITSDGGGAQAAVVNAASTSGKSFTLTFTPAKDFVGTVVVSYTLSNAFATSAPATITFIVNRPDPTKDPNVTGLINAQSEQVKEFARAQISNFDHRLEELHRRNDDGVPATHNSFGLSFNFGDYGAQSNPLNDPSVRERYAAEGIDPMVQTVANAAAWQSGPGFTGGYGGGFGSGSGGAIYSGSSATPLAGASRRGGGTDSGAGRGQPDSTATPFLPQGMSLWTAGNIDLGQLSAQPGQAHLKFSTAGLSFGLDQVVNDHFIVGAGVGYGDSVDVIGSTDANRVVGSNYVAAIYESFEPARRFFIDAVLGAGQVRFDTRRLTVASTLEEGNRSGDEAFASLTAAWELRNGGFHFSPYGRIDAASATLDAYAENGDPVFALTYESQTVRMLSGDLGARGDFKLHTGAGEFTPRFRIEYRHDFEGGGQASFNYTSLLGTTGFTVPTLTTDRDSLDVGVGTDWFVRNVRLSFDYEGSISGNQADQRLTFKFSAPF